MFPLFFSFSFLRQTFLRQRIVADNRAIETFSCRSNYYEDKEYDIHNQNSMVTIILEGCEKNSKEVKGGLVEIRGPHTTDPRSYCCGNGDGGDNDDDEDIYNE